MMHLEVLKPNGEIEMHPLDSQRGVTNIGRHPDNDIVVQGENFPPFFAILEHQTPPYRLIVLSEEAEVRLHDRVLSPHTPVELPDDALIQVNGYVLTLLRDEAAALPAPAAEAAALPRRRTGETSLVPFADRKDDILYADISPREYETDVEQTVVCQLTVANAGEIVAAFHIHVEGLPADWVAVSSPEVYLHEDEQAQITIAITPPRHPTSRAGIHYFAVRVTSPNYPGREAQIGLILTIHPYYEFLVGSLSPSRQTLSWRKRTGEARYTITNRSNTSATFQLLGEDDERRCTVEFLIPGDEGVQTLARQATITVPAGRRLTIPLRITPPPPPLLGWRRRIHSVMITTTMTGEEQSPHTLISQIATRPLIGPLTLIVLGVLLALLLVLVATPRIYAFEAIPHIVEEGKEVTLSWRVSPFVQRITIDGVDADLTPGTTSITVVPQPPATTYQLHANNILSRFFTQLEDRRIQTVHVMPPVPVINMFTLDRQQVVSGEPFTIKWSVSDAERITLIVGNVSEAIPPEEQTGERTYTLYDNALLVLEVSSATGSTLRSHFVKVVHPKVEFFEVVPSEITLGERVTLSWMVSGRDTVTISPFPDALPASGTIPHYPQETTAYVLTVPAGDTEIKVVRSVIVHPQPISETLASQPPTIDVFTVSPDTIGPEGGTVQLAWSISGRVTNVTIESLDAYNGDHLPPQDIITITLKQPTTFLLTAYNGVLSTSQAVEVTLDEKAAEEAAAEAEAQQPPEITFFKLEGDTGFEGSVTFVEQQQTAEGWPLAFYRVAQGAKILLSWETANADAVTLNGEDQPPVGDTTRVLAADADYRLVATNTAGGQEVQALIHAEAVPTTHPPQPPTVLYPADGQTGVAADGLTLRWQSSAPDGDPLTYDLALGTVNPPPLLAGNLNAPNYTLSTPLVPNTTYYWSVTVRDGTYTTTGPVWSFTTAAPTLCTPVLLDPAMGAVNVPLTPTFRWQCDNAANLPLTYALALGTAPQPLPIVADQIAATTYTPSTPLAPNTTYYWLVIVKSGSESRMSQTGQFTTTP